MSPSASSRLALSSPVRRRHVAAVLAALAALPASGQTTITYLNGQSASGAINTTLANPYTLFINSGTATQSGLISGSGSIAKTGAGSLTLSANNTYTGATTVDAGTLRLTGTLYSQGVSAGSITINSGGTLALNRNDILGVHTTSSPVTITIGAGGLLTNTGAAAFNTLNNLNLNGGTLFADAGNSSTWTAYQLKGTVTAGGSAPSAISTSGAANSQIQIGNNTASGSTIFNVADVTGSGAEDLVVSAVLQNGRDAGGTAVASGLVKTGAGSLTLSGANTFSGGVQLNSGTLGIGNDQALGSGTLVISGGTIRAVNAGRSVANPLTLNGSFTVGRLTTFTGAAALGTDITITADNYDGPANGDSIFNGVISGSGRSVTIAEGAHGLGTGAVVFGGANTYDGTTTVESGRLVLANTSASTAYVIDSGAVLDLSYASDTDLPTATFSGAGTLRKSGAGTVYWGGGAGTFALGSGSLIDVQGGTFRGGYGANEDWSANHSDLNVAAGATFNGVEANVRVNVLTGSGTIASGLNSGGGYLNFTFGVDGGSGTFAGVLADNGSDVGNYVKAGSGTQTLTGASTYTGSTTLAGGTLALGSAGALGSTSLISFTGGTLQFSAANTTDYSAVFDTSAGQLYRFDTNGQSVALASALTSSGGSLVKLGAGTLTLSGASTFAGGITVSGGTLRATTSASALGAGSLTLAGGSLTLANDANLSFSRPTTVSADATITIDRLTSGTVATLTHTLGTLSIGAQTLSSARGSNITSGTGAVTFGNTTLTGDAVFSPGANSQINLSTVSQSGGARSLTVDGAGILNLQSSTGTYTGVTTVRNGGILLVTNSIGNGNVSSAIGIAGNDAANLVINGGTLRLTNGTNTDRLFTLGTSGGTLDVPSGGSVFFNNPGSIALSGTNASRTLTLASATGSVNLFTPALGDNGAGATSLTKTGNGYWILGGASTYTGPTTVTGGILGLTGSATLASTNLVLSGGGVLALSGTTPALGTGPGQVQFSGSGGGGFAAYGGPLTVTTFASTPIWGAGGVLADNVNLALGSSISTHALTLPSAIDLGTGQTRTFNVFDNTATPDDLVTLSGVVSGGTSTFFKNGAGTLVLTAANTYAGSTTVANGTLALAGSGTISAANLNLNNGGVLATNDGIGFSRAFGTGAGQVQLSGLGGGFAAYGGPLTLSFAGTPVWGSTSGFSGTLYFGSVNADDVVTWTTPFSLGSSSRSIQVNDNPFSTADYAVVSGVISGNANVGLTKFGSGLLVLSGANTYTGATTITTGTLAVTSLPSVGAGPGSLGAPTTVANGTIALSGGTLRYTGAGDTTDRILSIPTTAAATVEASGTGPIVFTSDLSVTGGNTKSFILGGTSTAANEFRGAIVNNSATNLTLLAKTGPGTWIISGNNTYTGSTTVTEGTLRLGSSTALANSALTVNSSAPGTTPILDLGGFDATVSSLTLGGNTGASPTSSASIAATGGGTLTLGGNVTYNTTGNPLGSTIAAGLNLGSATRTFTVNDSTTAAIDLAVSGNIGETASAGLTKTGTGALLLSGANTYTGGATLSQGTLIAGSNSAFGTGTLTFAGGILQGDGTPRTLANPVSLTGTGPVFGGAGDLTLTGQLTNNSNNNVTLSFTNTGATTLGPIALANSATNRTASFQTTGGLVTLGGAIANGGGSTASGITKTGSGTLALAAVNTYGGTTAVSDGTLRLDIDGAIPSASAVVLNAPAAATPLYLDLHGHATTVGSLTLTTGNFASGQVIDSSGGGLLSLGGNLTYNTGAAVASTGSVISAALDLGTATRTFLVNDSTGITTDLAISGVISDTSLAGLIKTGNGTLALSGANTYRGATTLTAGTVSIDSLPSVGAGPGPLGAPATVADGTIALIGGTLRYTGASRQVTDRVVNLSGGATGGTIDASGAGPLVFSSAFTATGAGSKTLVLTGTGAGANEIQGAIVNNSASNTTAVTKTGSGTWILSGANTYTGATTVNDGTLLLGASNALTLSPLTVASTLPGGTATFDLNGFNATVPGLTLGGAAGSTSTTVSRVLATGGGVLSIGVNGLTYSNTSNNAGALVSAALDLGTASRTFTVNDSTAADADLTVSGSISSTSSGGSLVKTGLGTLVLSGVNTYTGTTTISQGTVRLGSANALPATALTIASNNAGVTAALDLNGYDLTVAGLTFGGTGTNTSASTLIATGGGTLTLGGDLTYSNLNSPLGATLSAALNLGATSGRTFNIADSPTSNSDLTVTGSIGESLANTALIKTNSGVLTLTAPNTYTGPTLVNGGALALTGSGTISAANLYLNGGVFATNDTIGFSRPLGFGNGQVQIGNNGGFAAHGGNLTLSSFTGTPEWGLAPGFVPSGSTLAFGSPGADGVVTWTNPFSLGAGNTRTITVTDNTATAADLAVISGVISSGANGALTKAGAGTLVLTAANTYTGVTTVTGGTLALTGSGTISAANLTLTGGVLATNDTVGFTRALGTGTGQVQLAFSGGGFAAYGGPLTLSSFTGTPVWGSTTGFFSGGGSTLFFGSVNATDTVTWTNDFSLGSTNRTIQVTDNLFTTADSSVISGVISGGTDIGFTKTGNGTLVLSGANTYTGATTVSSGILSISSLPSVGGGAGSLGAPTTVANGTIGLNGGTLRYTGPAQSTDRVLNLTASSSVEASGAGPLTFTSALTSTTGGAKTLTLTGTSAAANTFQGAIVNGSGTTSLAKTGSGTWVLSGNNTYTGSTTVSDGTLSLGASSSLLNNTALTVASNVPGGTATLDLNGFNAIASSLTLGDAAGSSSASGSQILATGGGILSLNGNVTFNSVNNPTGASVTAGLNLGSATRTFTVADSTSAAYDLAVSGPISENTASGLIKAGAGTLLLSGANTYTGGTTINAGTVVVGSDTAFGTGGANFSGGALRSDLMPRTLANAFNVTSGTAGVIAGTSDLTFTGTLTNTFINNFTTLTVSNAGTTTFSGPISLGTSTGGRGMVFNTTGGLVTLSGVISNGPSSTTSNVYKTGSGTLEIGAANTYTGSTFVLDGTLRLGAAGSLPTSLSVTAGYPGAAAVFDLNGRSITLSGLTVGGSGQTTTTIGTVGGSGATSTSSGNLIATGGGLITLSGNVTYQATGNPLGSTIAANLNFGTGGRTFFVNDSTTAPIDLTVSGNIAETAVGSSLTKSSAGTLLLSGTNTYTGSTVVNDGTLRLGSAAALPATALSLAANASGGTATLDLGGYDASTTGLTFSGSFANNTTQLIATGGGALTLLGNAGVTYSATNNPLGSLLSADLRLGAVTRTFSVGDSTSTATELTVSGNISGTGAGLTKNGTGALLLSGANTYTGATTVNDGTLRLGSSTALPAGTALTIASNITNGTATLDLNGQNATVASLSFGGINAGALTNSASSLTATGGGTLTLSGALTYSPLGNPLGAVVSGGLVLSSGSTQLFQIDDSTTAAADLTISGAIGGTASSGFTKNGAGTLVLSGANTYTGPTVINEGTVLLGAAGSLSSGSALSLANSPRARLDLAGYNQVIGGLSGGGSLGGNVSLGSASLTVRGGGSYSGALSGSGSLIKEGSATLSFPTAQAYTGGTTLRAGTLELGQDGSLGSGPLTVTGGSLAPLGASRSLGNALTLNGSLGLSSSAANYAFTFSGPVTLAGDSTVAATQSAGSLDVVHTFSGVIDGAHALTLSRTGAATLGATGGFVLSGANTFSGGLTVENTRLFVSAEPQLGAATGGLTLNGGILQTSVPLATTRLLTLGTGGGTIEHGANALTFTGLSGSGDLTKTGSGTLTLTGTSTYDGVLTSSTDLALAPGASLRFGPLAGTNTGIVNDGTLIFNSTGARSFDQLISGSGSVEIEGSSTGVFSLGAVNTYAGDTTLRSGTLAFSDLSNLGSTGDLVFAGGTLRWATGNTADPSARFAPLAGSDASFDPNGQAIILGTALTGNGGLILAGSGTLTLGAANTYAGNATVRDGTLVLGAASALPATGVELRSSTAGGTATLDLNGHDATVSALTLGGATATSTARVLATGGGTLALAGDVTFDATNAPLGASIATNLNLGSGATRTFAIGDSASAATDLTVTGSLGQTASSGLTKTGAGTLALDAVNTYTGLTTIQAGTLRLDLADALPSGNSVAIADAAGARLDLAGHNQTLAALTGGGSSGGEVALGSAALTVSSGSYDGLLSGSGSLVKTSAGTLSLTHGNTYTGGTTLGAGSLQLGNDAALGTGPLTVTGGTLAPLGSARTLGNALTLDGDLTLATSGGSPYAVTFTGATTLTRDLTLTASQDSGTLNVAHTFSGVIDGAHALTLTRTGAASLVTSGGFAFSGSNTFSGGLTIDATRLFVSSDANLGDASGGLTLRNGGILSPTTAFTSGRVLTVGSGGGVLEQHANAVSLAGLSGSGDLFKTGSGTLTLTGTSTYNGTFTSSNALVLDTGASFRFGPQGTTSSSIVDNGTLAFDSTSSRTFSKVISGSGSVAVEGTSGAVLTLSGLNSYSGGTVLRGGTLFFAAPFNLGSGNVTFDGGTLRWGIGNTTDISARLAPLGASGGTADLNGQALTFATAITGTGGLALTGGGSLTLTADNTFGGALTIGSGTTVNLGTGGTIGSVTGPVVNNGALVINRSDNVSYQGVLSGSGLFTKNGAGSLTLGGDNSGFSGASSLNAGTVVLAHNNALGTGAATLNGASLEASGGARTVATPFRLNADTTIGGSNALTLSGSFTLLRNRDLTVSNTAVTTISGSIGQSGGGRGLNKYGAGELQLTGASTYSGGTYIGEGTVRINNLTGSAFGTGAVTVESGATLAGAGSFTGALQLNPGATFAPGNSPGLATIGSGSVFEGATVIEIAGTDRSTASEAGAGHYDAIDVGLNGTGSVILGGELQVVFFGGYVPTGSASFQIFRAGSIGGSFAQVSLPTSPGYQWDTSRLETEGILGLSAIPEPTTVAGLAGLAALGFALRRRRNRG